MDIGHGPKAWLIVSNNQRNRKLDTVLAARVTTSDKSGIPTAVGLVAADQPLVGYVLTDDLVQLFDDDIAGGTYLGAISPVTVPRVNAALAMALGLP